MAALGSQSIAGSYEQLLHVDRDGGGNTTTLVAVKDGDNGTTFCLQLSTTKAMIKGSGSKLYFSDEGGEYLSGNNTALTLNSGEDINLTCATGDVNIPVNIGLRFGDGGENIETDNTDFTISSGGKLNLTATSDVHVANGTGVVIGHTAQETISIGDGSTDLVPEVQVLGTAQADASLMLAAFSATATSAGAPLLALVKSGDAAIDGTHVIVTDGEELGNIIAYGDDGVDLESPAASIQFEVDGTPGAGDMPGRIIFNTCPDGGSVLTERVRIPAAGGIYEKGGVLKENLLTNSGFDVWSNSAELETVSTPAADDAADDDASDWTSSAGSLAFDTDHYEIVASTTKHYLTSVTFKAGALYKFSYQIKDGTASGVSVEPYARDSSTETFGTSTVTTGSFVTKTFVFENGAATSSGRAGVRVGGTSSNNMEIKNFVLTEVTPGCVAVNGLAFDGWTKDGSASYPDIYREHWGSNDGDGDDDDTTKSGSFYSLKILATESNALHRVYTTKSTLHNNADWYTRFAGRTVTMGAWAKTDTASTARLGIKQTSGTTYSSYHSGDNTWEWLEVTIAIASNTTQFIVELHCEVDTKITYYSQPMLVFGSSIGEGNYTRPQGEIVNCEKYITIISNESPAAADDKILNLEAISDGMIPKGCKSIHMSAQALNSSITSDQGVQWGTSSSNVTSLRCNPVVNNVYQSESGMVECDSNGDIYQLVKEAGATMSGVYCHVTQVHLR